jgi:H+-translocating NAD(P) transhydrogenase subunit alpha
MIVGIPVEVFPEELRVAATPKTIQRLRKLGFEVWIQKGAGQKSGISDSEYEEANAHLKDTAAEIYRHSDLVLKVKEPSLEEVTLMKEGLVLMSYLWPAQNQELLEALAQQNVSAIAMDAIPRITRAQKMDVLSSMANIAGYRSVIEASYHYGRFLNGQITAAGKIEPAKVLVIGAGVAGLAAIGAAHSLGAIVRAFDTRKEVAEQVASMGASFLTVEVNEDGATSSGYSKEMSKAFIEAEMKLFLEQAKEVDILITTAQIPGRKAPQLILDYHVQAMKAGSVIVDLAATSGGNCQLTRNGEVYTTDNGVTIVGRVNPLPQQASQLYGNNLCHLLDDMGKAENFRIDREDAIISRAMVTYEGKIHWPPAPLPVSLSAAGIENKTTAHPELLAKQALSKSKKAARSSLIGLSLVGLILLLVGGWAPPSFIQHFTVFVLAIFVGWQVIHTVSHALHTPLMAVTNAISGIIVVGGLLQTKNEISHVMTLLALVAILIAAINIVGGFLVTHRMLKMFRK